MRSAHWLPVLVLLFFCSSLNAQQRRLDSLHAVNNSYHKEDSLKVVYLKDLFRAYAQIKNQPMFRVYADSAIEVASKLPNKATLAMVYYRLGSVFFTADKLQAITYYRKGIEAAHTAGAVKAEANCYLNLGALYEGVHDYPASLEAHEKALALYASINDKDDMTSCYMNLANIYNGMQQRVKAIQYAARALADFESGGAQRGIGVAGDVLGSVYLAATDAELREAGVDAAERLSLAEKIFSKGLAASLKTDDNGLVASLYADFGRLYEIRGKYEDAARYYNKAQDISSKDEIDKEAYIDNLLLAGSFYLTKMNNRALGSSMLYRGMKLAEKNQRLGTLQDILFALSDMHAAQKQYDSALHYFRRAVGIRDSLNSREREQEITRRQLKLDYERKVRDYHEAQQLSDAKLAQQVLLAKQQEQELLVKKQQLELISKEKTLQRLRFLQEQAELQKQKKEQDSRLAESRVKAEYDKRIRDEKIHLQNAELFFNKRLVLFLGIVVLLVLFASGFIYYSRNKTMRLNQTISSQKQELEQLGKVKDKILSVVSHDLRAPVNNLMAFRSILNETQITPEKLALYINQLKNTMDHTAAMMENLLNWSASQMQGFSVQPEKIRIRQVLADLLPEIETIAAQKNIAIHNSIPGELSCYADRNMLALVMRNLVNNAIKFSHKTGKITISSSVTPSGTVSVYVKDEGIGLSQENVSRINAADLYAMESRRGTEKEKGTGLGLMLCKHFALLMNGSLQVESKEGEGSRFSLLLPQAEA